jgi:hypothetical protein
LEDESPTKTLEEQEEEEEEESRRRGGEKQAIGPQKVPLPVTKDQVNDQSENDVVTEMADKKESISSASVEMPQVDVCNEYVCCMHVLHDFYVLTHFLLQGTTVVTDVSDKKEPIIAQKELPTEIPDAGMSVKKSFPTIWTIGNKSDGSVKDSVLTGSTENVATKEKTSKRKSKPSKKAVTSKPSAKVADVINAKNPAASEHVASNKPAQIPFKQVICKAKAKSTIRGKKAVVKCPTPKVIKINNRFDSLICEDVEIEHVSTKPNKERFVGPTKKARRQVKKVLAEPDILDTAPTPLQIPDEKEPKIVTTKMRPKRTFCLKWKELIKAGILFKNGHSRKERMLKQAKFVLDNNSENQPIFMGDEPLETDFGEDQINWITPSTAGDTKVSVCVCVCVELCVKV